MKLLISYLSIFVSSSAIAAEWNCQKVVSSHSGVSTYYNGFQLTPVNEKVADFLDSVKSNSEICFKGESVFVVNRSYIFVYDIKLQN